MDVLRPYDCLLNCLKEVHLDRFHPNFVRQGVTNCGQLCRLSAEQYSIFGILSMEDRRNLYDVIQIIKSLQAGGVRCNHGASNSKIQNPGISSQDKAIFRKAKDKRDDPQAANNFIKPVNLSKNFKVTFDRSAEEDLRQQQRIAKSRFSLKNQTDSPEFQCKKTLDFSDPDLYSDEDQISGKRVQPPSVPAPVQKFQEPVHENSSVKTAQKLTPALIGLKSAQEDSVKNGNNSEGVKSTLSAEQTMPAAAFASTLVFNMKPSSSQQLKGITKEVVSLPVNAAPNRKSRPHEDQSARENNFNFRPTKSTKQGFQHNPNNILKYLPGKQHAYFPPEAGGETSKPMHVEQVVNGTGYSYGIPSDDNNKSQNCSPDVGDRDFAATLRNLYPDRIRVCVRKRPRNATEMKRSEKDIIRIHRPQTVVVQELKVAVDLTKFIHQHTMKFDDVFDDKCGNHEVYDRVVKPLIDSLFKRGSAICFAFGQTGAGKTHTLMGNRSVPGLYQLAAKDLFEIANSGRYREPLRLWVSFYEIYCGHVYDLLNRRNRLHIRENGKQKVCVAGLMENPVQDIENLTQVINYGNSFRSRGSTGVNPHSSRSHAILEIQVRDFRENRVGRLKFIDLAGSERASDATNLDRQTRIEGAEINQSLLALKECIRSIDQESVHTPYRQSKLTLILRDSFLGKAQTVMIANVAPTQSACENTLNTLRYADRVQELRREVALRMQKRLSPGTDIKESTQSKSPAAKQQQTHSFFHPSDIPFSSTPLKDNAGLATTAVAAAINLSEIAQESPLSGHKFDPRRGGGCDAKEILDASGVSPIEEIRPISRDCSREEGTKSGGEGTNEGIKTCTVSPPSERRRNYSTNSSSCNNNCNSLESRQVDFVLPCSCQSTKENSDVRPKDHESELDLRKTKSHATEMKLMVEQDPDLSHRLRPNGLNGRCEPAQLVFLEAKLYMENARGNIRDFLDNEKRDRIALKPNVESDPRIKLIKERMTDIDKFLNRHFQENADFASVRSSELTSQASNSGVRISNSDSCSVGLVIESQSISDGVTKPLTNSNTVEDHKDLKSWATILQESSRLGKPRPDENDDSSKDFRISGPSGGFLPNTAAAADDDGNARTHLGDDDADGNPDDCGNEDRTSFIASEEIRLLKMKIEELKIQRELLDNQQVEFERVAENLCPSGGNDAKRRRNLYPVYTLTAQGRIEKASREVSEDILGEIETDMLCRDVSEDVPLIIETNMVRVDNKNPIPHCRPEVVDQNGNIDKFSVQDACAKDCRRNIYKVDSFGNINCNHASCEGLCTRESGSIDEKAKHIPGSHQLLSSLHKTFHQKFGDDGKNDSRKVVQLNSLVDHSLARSLHDIHCELGVEPLVPSGIPQRTSVIEKNRCDIENAKSRDDKILPNVGATSSSLALHSNSAFIRVVPSTNNFSGKVGDDGRLAENPKPASVVTLKSTFHRVDPSTGNNFEPIEPFPLTSKADKTSTLRNGKCESEVALLDHVETEASNAGALDRTRTLLVTAHEEQLTAVTQLCKREMLLLMAIRTGRMSYPLYMQNVRDILSKKSKIVLALMEHISEFNTSLEH